MDVWSCGGYFRVSAVELSTLLEITKVSTICPHESCTRLTRPTWCILVALGLKGQNGGKINVYIVFASVCDAYFVTPALAFSTLLEETDAVQMYVHPTCA